MTARPHLLALLFLLGLAYVLPALAAPDWVADPANSKWIVFGGEQGIAEESGLHVRPGEAEGNLARAERGGLPCAQSLTPEGKPGFFYLLADPWEQFRVWQGDSDLQLTVRYWDGAPGQFIVRYDSSDSRVKMDPYPPGVWRYPDSLQDPVILTGTKTWKTLTVRLELAMFTKRVHGADLRIDPLCADFALAGVAVTRLPRQATQVQVTQNLRVQKATGFESFGSGARFAGTFAQQADEPIVMQGELCTVLGTRDGHTPGADPQASGGAFLHYVASASWKFTVKTPGKYRAWERASFPWAGGWCHTESMDGGAALAITDGGKPEDGWKWVAAGEYNLTPGTHTFSLNYEAGARLDVVVLSRSDQPPDVAALTSSYVGPLAGEVWTAPLKPFDVAAWKTVRFDVVGKLATATYEYSLDGGKRWAAFDPAAGLGQIKPVGGGADNLQFHLRLEGAPGQAPPFLVGAAVDYVAGPNNVRYLENSRLRIGIDPYGVRSLYDKRAGRAIAVAPETHDSLVMLVTKAPGNAPTSGQDLYGGTLDDFQLGGTAESPTLTMKHSLPSGISLVSTLKLLPDGQTEWQLRIDNRSPQEVAEVRFPVVTGVALGGDPSDDWAFVPKYWGQVWKNPSADPLITFWGPSMRWMDLWDGQSGVYLGLEDPKFEDWAFVYGGDRNGTTLSAHQRILAKPSGSWQSGTYRLAVHGGDWHQGGDIYRKYVATALQPPSTPPHVKWLLDSWCVQGSGYAGVMGWDMVYEAYGGLDNRPSYFMAANRQMMDGADAGYCGLYPYPSIAWGTTREYAQKLAIRKALGGMYTPYHNFQLWTPAFGHYNRVGVFPKSILPPDANVPDDDWYHRAASYTYTGSYQGGEADYYGEYQMAMGSKEWRDWLYDWTRRYLTWGTDGMYYDQFNMIYPNGRLYPDFPTYGCWAPALVQTFSKMVKDSRARNRYYTSSGEVCNDVYAQYNDMGMASGVWNRDDFWYYCNPHRLLIDGSWNGGLADFWGGWERERFIWQTGARFEEFVLPKENGQAWGASLLALRVATKSLLYDADFRDTVGLTITAADGKPLGPEPFFSGKHESGPFRGQSGRWFLFKQGAQSGAVVNFINTPTVAGATVHFSTKETGPLSSAVAWTLDGKVSVLRGAQQGDTYSFPLPEAECSSVVLAGTRLRPVVEWDLTGPATFGSKRSLTLKVTNPNSVPMSGTATLRLPASWPAAPAVKFGPLAPGAGASLLVPFTVGAKATKGRADIWCDVTSGGLTFSTYSFITVNDPVLIDFRGGPGDAHIWLKNLSTQPVTGTVTVSAPAPLRVSCAATFGVPADSEAKVPVTVANQEQLKRISELQARVTIGGQTTEVVRGVMPIVANGDFEADGAGDLEPDWWMCRKAVDVWAFEHKRLSPDAHGGKYSLMLDAPTPEDKFYRAYPVNGCAKGSTRYRISVWIKAESDKEVYFHLGGLSLGAGKTGPEWKQFTGEITTGPDPRGGWVYVAAYNGSTGKAWFDDIVVEEIK